MMNYRAAMAALKMFPDAIWRVQLKGDDATVGNTEFVRSFLLPTDTNIKLTRV